MKASPLLLIALAQILAVSFSQKVFAAISDPHLNSEGRYYDLAQKYAPVILQQSGNFPRADIFTRFDFDGDWNGDNNWENVKNIDVAPIVYFDVIESETHYFITYSLFYPRDYLPVCMPEVCHENDFEGMRLTVEKNTGEVWLLETEHHGMLSTLSHPSALALPGTTDARVTVISEPGKHGFHPFKNTSPGALPRGTLYVPSNPATGASSPQDVNRYDRFDQYEMIPLLEIWDHRDEIGAGKAFYQTFDHQGSRYSLGSLPSSFAGRKWARGGANPVWAWKLRGDLKRGDWFLDPAESICRIEHCPAGFSKEYVFNPYLDIDS